MDGEGTTTDPYIIQTLQDLQDIRDHSGTRKYYVLANDIDASETEEWNHNGSYYEGFLPLGVFKGSFEGNCHTISGLYINRPDGEYQGLFGHMVDSRSTTDAVSTTDPGTPRVVNLNIEDASVTGMHRAGILASSLGVSYTYNLGSTNRAAFVPAHISNCHVSGYLDGRCIERHEGINWTPVHNGIGGLVGYTSGLIVIHRCTSRVRIDSSGGGGMGSFHRSPCMPATGGLVGFSGSGLFIECAVYNSVPNRLFRDGAGTGFGNGSGGRFYRCSTEIDVIAPAATGGVGGFTGRSGYFYDCIAGGTRAEGNPLEQPPGYWASVNWGIGGFCGRDGTFKNCYAIPYVEGHANRIGGFSSFDSVGTGVDCFWDVQTSGVATSGVGTGKSTALMKDITTFPWDFNYIWQLDAGRNAGYPHLRIPAGNIWVEGDDLVYLHDTGGEKRIIVGDLVENLVGTRLSTFWVEGSKVRWLDSLGNVREAEGAV